MKDIIATVPEHGHYIEPFAGSLGYVDRMAAAAERLSRASLECRPALDLIERSGRSSEVLLHVDPPYLGSACAWGSNYRHEMRTDDEHHELAEAVNNCEAAVVLSGYPSAPYNELYADWHRTTFEATTGQGGSRSERAEVLWANRLPQPTLFRDLDNAPGTGHENQVRQ